MLVTSREFAHDLWRWLATIVAVVVVVVATVVVVVVVVVALEMTLTHVSVHTAQIQCEGVDQPLISKPKVMHLPEA